MLPVSRDGKMKLDELTFLEYEWLAKQQSVQGAHDDRDAAYERMGVYEAWREIFREYVMLSRDGDLEALKRALFLWWYGYSEPHWLSGILKLDCALGEEVLRRVNELASKGQLDEELKWMLPWYYSICDQYFGGREGIDALKQASVQETNGRDEQWWRLQCGRSSFEHRGQMGEYWGSVRSSLNQPGADRDDNRRPVIQAPTSQGLPTGVIRRICSTLGLPWRRRIKR
jgi:hypothetical protein